MINGKEFVLGLIILSLFYAMVNYPIKQTIACVRGCQIASGASFQLIDNELRLLYPMDDNRYATCVEVCKQDFWRKG